MKSQLVQLGLTDGEARTYLALLKTGPSTVGPIAKTAHISYSKIYEVLERLLDKGLVSVIKKNNAHQYQAVEPAQLTNYIEQQEQQLQEKKKTITKMLPQLEAHASSH